MTTPVKNEWRIAVLLSIALLGLQFLFLPALQSAANMAVLKENTSPLGPKGEGGGSDVDQAIELAVMHAERFRGSFEQEAGLVFLGRDADRHGIALLPVAGLHPSAP